MMSCHTWDDRIWSEKLGGNPYKKRWHKVVLFRENLRVVPSSEIFGAKVADIEEEKEADGNPNLELPAADW